ncbi:MAG: tetratricopeptide repeat protein [Cyclobacteriaceae bacterium]
MPLILSRHLLIGFILVLLTTAARDLKAQNERDSLRRIIPQLKGIRQIDAINHLASYLLTIDPDQSDSLATTALSMNPNYSRGTVKSWLVLATMHSQQRNTQKADSLLDLAIPLARKLDDDKSMTMALLTRGVLRSRKGQHAEALEDHIQGARLAKSVGDVDLELSHLLNIGSLKQLVNDLEGAEKYLREALDISQSSGLRFRSGQVYVNLAVVAYKKDDLDLSIDYNNKALALFEAEGDKSQAAICLNNLGFAYNILGQHDTAIAYYDRAMELSLSVNDKFGVTTVLLNQARILKDVMRYYMAESKASEALNMAEGINDQFSKSRVRLFLAELFEASGDHTRALAQFKAYKTLEDSIAEKANRDKMAELTAEFELERKEDELQLSRERVRLLGTRQVLLVSILLLMLAVVSAIWIFYRSKVRKVRMQKELAEVERKHQQLLSMQLSQELKIKEKELLAYAGELSRQNALMTDLEVKMEAWENSKYHEVGKELIKRLSEQVQRRPTDYLSWREFRLKFDEVHPTFISGLVEQFPQLTAYERDFACLIKINLSNKEVAQILNISYDSSKKSIQRLYRKLGFPSAEELRSFILKL